MTINIDSGAYNCHGGFGKKKELSLSPVSPPMKTQLGTMYVSNAKFDLFGTPRINPKRLSVDYTSSSR